MRTRSFTVLTLLLASVLLVSAADQDCSFLKNPDEFVVDSQHRHTMRSDLAAKIQTYMYAASAASTLDANTIPHKNFIDDAIFSRMAGSGIPSAPLSSDAERLWVHTKNSVDPGMYSQRSTAFPRSDLKLKSGLDGAAVESNA